MLNNFFKIFFRQGSTKKLCSAQSGMSLVELLMAVVFIGGISLTVAQLMKQAGDQTSKSKTRYDEAEFLMALHSQLMQPTVCEMNFPVGSILSLLPTTNTINTIVNSEGTLAEIGETYGENGDLTISDMNTAFDPLTSWIKLNITFAKNRATTGPKTITRSLLLFAEVNAGTGAVVRCLGSSLSVQDSGEDLSCDVNTSEYGRNVMVKIEDPADPTQTICVKKAFNTDGCGLLDERIVYGFTYDPVTYLYDFDCDFAMDAFLCPATFLMKFSATGEPYCDNVSQLQTFQPFDGPAATDCTGQSVLGLENTGTDVRVYCDAAKATAPTATPTPTYTATPAPTVASGACGCASRAGRFSYRIAKADIPDGVRSQYSLTMEDDCSGSPPAYTYSSVTACTMASGSVRNICGVSVTNVGGSAGNYTIVGDGNIYPTTGGAGLSCGSTMHASTLAAGDYILIQYNVVATAGLGMGDTCNVTLDIGGAQATYNMWYSGGAYTTIEPSTFSSNDGTQTFTCVVQD